jgi:hypothetical protein
MIYGLHVKAVWDDPDLIEVMVRVAHGEYAGTASVYVGIGELATTASTLRGFPSTPTDRRSVKWGEFGPGTAGGAVTMTFEARARGNGAVADIHVECDQARVGSVQSAVVRIEVEAAAVDAFVEGLEAIEVGKRGAAFLRHGCG